MLYLHMTTIGHIMKKKLSKKKIEIVLNKEDILTLTKVIKHGSNNVRVITRARILLLSHEGKTNIHIVEALSCAPRMICNIRQRYIKEKSVLKAIADAPRPGQPKKIEAKHEIYVVAVACTKAPKGHNHWTLPELKKKLLIKYKKLKTVSDERVRQMLLASALKPWREKNVVYT